MLISAGSFVRIAGLQNMSGVTELNRLEQENEKQISTLLVSVSLLFSVGSLRGLFETSALPIDGECVGIDEFGNPK